MKTFSIALWLTFSVLSTPAVSETLLSGTGAEFPSSLPADSGCSLSASERHIDYGVQSRGQLQALAGGSLLSPGQRSVMLTVVCPYAQTMVMAVRGEATASGDLRYGERGGVKLRILDVSMDGKNVHVAATLANGTPDGQPSSGLRLQPGQHVGVIQNGHLLNGKTLSARIEIEPIMPEGDARVSYQHTTESRLTLELID